MLLVRHTHLLNYRLPYTDIYPLTNSWVQSEYSNFIHQYRPNTGNFYFDYCYSSSATPWFTSKKRSLEKEITTFNRMRSNHYNLAHSLYRKNLVDSPTCICGEDDEDLNHVFWSCPRFADERTSMLTELKKLKLFPPYTITSFLHAPEFKTMAILLRFLSECNLFI